MTTVIKDSKVAGRKRTYSKMEQEATTLPESPILAMFEGARGELDEHHDRRERIVKASRDITAASKKIIFALQRVRSIGEPIHGSITSKTEPLYEVVNASFLSVAPELQGINAYRYARNITGGIQEFMEAILFQHYLETQSLMSYETAAIHLTKACGEGPTIQLTINDYLLGILDMTGELMRFSITSMATSRGAADAGDTKRNVLQDLRELRRYFEALDTGSDHGFSKDANQKLQVLQASVEKVEKGVYNLTVRGSERPEGWVPPDGSEDTRAREEVTSY